LVLVYGLIWKAIIPIKPAVTTIASRNLLLPIALLAASIAVCFVIKNKNWAKWLLLILVAFDLGRFTVKFTPFSAPEYTSRPIPVFEYIKSQADVGRVITENGPILPANTWIYPGLYSPSGYDPLLIKDYAVFYRGLNMGQKKTLEAGESLGGGLFTRYLNVVNLNSSILDLVGAKYLLTVKYDPYGNIRPWGNVNGGAIDLKRYKPVFENGESVVLQNQTALPRAVLFYKAETEMDNVKAVEKLVTGFDFQSKILINKENLKQYPQGRGDTAEITNYSANKIDISTKTQNGAYLFLSDTFYPGWQVSVNGKRGEMLRADSTFRAVEVPPGDSHVEMVYSPVTFKVGAAVSAISLIILLILVFIKPFNRKSNI
jgi:hypothetical protein